MKHAKIIIVHLYISHYNDNQRKVKVAAGSGCGQGTVLCPGVPGHRTVPCPHAPTSHKLCFQIYIKGEEV